MIKLTRTYEPTQRRSTYPSPSMKLTLSLGMILVAIVAAGCGKPRLPAQAPPTVTVSQPAQEQVAEFIDLTGTVAPSKTVDLVARVSGYLDSVNFQEGSFVEAGRVLFVIEPEPYKEQLQAAQASLLRARSEYERQVELMKEQATSLSNLEKWQSERDQAAAQVALARINLSYTEVKAPFSGRISRRLVDPGNLVGPGATVKLATLDQLVPIYVNFSLNERDALRIRQSMRQRGRDPQFLLGKMPVWAGLPIEEGFSQEGRIDYIDTGVNPSTGTILMRASFTNENWTLFPGLFARVRFPLSLPEPTLVLPNTAIGNDQEGDYVLVLDRDDVVVRRGIAKGPRTASGWAIRSGVTAHDRVIINGLIKARPGSKVTPASVTPVPPPPPKAASIAPRELQRVASIRSPMS